MRSELNIWGKTPVDWQRHRNCFLYSSDVRWILNRCTAVKLSLQVVTYWLEPAGHISQPCPKLTFLFNLTWFLTLKRQLYNFVNKHRIYISSRGEIQYGTKGQNVLSYTLVIYLVHFVWHFTQAHSLPTTNPACSSSVVLNQHSCTSLLASSELLNSAIGFLLNGVYTV